MHFQLVADLRGEFMRFVIRLILVQPVELLEHFFYFRVVGLEQRYRITGFPGGTFGSHISLRIY
ncbi:MAG: hypothetical protein ABIS45_17275 [Burkholderiales bacterium]